MGVRKVLGASVGSIFFHLSKEYFWLVLLAFLLATPMAKLVTYKWLQGLPFGSTRAGMFISSPALLLFVREPLRPISFHALRTAFVNPIRQLRTE